MLLVDYSKAYLRRLPADRRRLLPPPIPSFWGKETHSGWHTLMPIEGPRFAVGQPGTTEIHYLLGWNSRTGDVAKLDMRNGQLSGTWQQVEARCVHEGSRGTEFHWNQLKRRIEAETKIARGIYERWMREWAGKTFSKVLQDRFISSIGLFRDSLVSLREEACKAGFVDLSAIAQHEVDQAWRASIAIRKSLPFQYRAPTISAVSYAAGEVVGKAVGTAKRAWQWMTGAPEVLREEAEKGYDAGERGDLFGEIGKYLKYAALGLGALAVIAVVK